MIIKIEPVNLSDELVKEYKNLYHNAADATKKAYVPNSQSKVGAAILGGGPGEDTIVTGANFEFSRYADHAEQVAIAQALSSGMRAFKAIAISVNPREQGAKPTKPCGNCRQALMEIQHLNPGSSDLHVVTEVTDDRVIAHSARDLLTDPYNPGRAHYEFPNDIEQLVPSVSRPLLKKAILACRNSYPWRTGRPEAVAIQLNDHESAYNGIKVELSSFSTSAARMALADAFLKANPLQIGISRVAIVGLDDKRRPVLPPDMNWDSWQALYKFGPKAIVEFIKDGSPTELPINTFILQELLQQR